MKHPFGLPALSAILTGVLTATAAQSAVILSETFESVSPGAVPAGWSVTTPANTSIGITTATASEGLTSLRFDDNSTVSGYPYATVGFTPVETGVVRVSVDIRAVANNRDSLYVKLRNSDNQEIGGVRFSLNGTFAYQLETGAWQNSSVSYSANQWYSIKIDYDLDARTYSAWADGNLIVTDAAFRTIATDSSAASLLLQSMAGVASYTGSAMVDNLEISATAIPEPSSAASLAGGACALFFLTGRLRRPRRPASASSCDLE